VFDLLKEELDRLEKKPELNDAEQRRYRALLYQLTYRRLSPATSSVDMQRSSSTEQ
jgi:hypothetical protein